MALPRARHQATLLRNGRVLITATGTPNAELYDPDTGKFIPTGAMAVGRKGHSATLLPDGRVLIAGGTDDGDRYVMAAEIYDPFSGAFAPAGQMVTETAWHSATLLKNGKVLLACGYNGRPGIRSAPVAQLYDPSTGQFALTGDYAFRDSRGDYGLTAVPATLLPSGKVLIAAEPIAELYDPDTGTFALTGRMMTGSPDVPYIAGRTATLLRDGKVLLAGGDHEDFGRFGEVESYDPATGAFTLVGRMSIRRTTHTATLLADSRVLIAGGDYDIGPAQPGGGVTATTEIYDVVAGQFAAGPIMTSQRCLHTATLLIDGRVLLTGGYATYAPSSIVSKAELFVPDGWVPPAPAAPAWSFDDIGNVGIAGSNTSAGATITLRGSGGDIWDTADGYRFVYRTWTGDGAVEARVGSMDNSHEWAKAGVMIREGVSPSARNVLAFLTPRSDFVFAQARAETAGETMLNVGPARPAAGWVRLTRVGNTITAATSADGITWANYASYTMSLGETLLFGFAVTSHDNAQLNTAVFTDPSVH